MLVALNFAEVSSHFRWPVRSSNDQVLAGDRTRGSRVGFTSSPASSRDGRRRDVAAHHLADVEPDGLEPGRCALHDQIWVAAITLVVITVLNIYSVKVVSVVNNTASFSRCRPRGLRRRDADRAPSQPISVVTNTGGLHLGFGSFFLAMFMSLFVIYGMDTVHARRRDQDPRRAAPKAVLSSVGGAFIIGGIFLIAILMAIPNLKTPSQCWDRRRSSRPLL